MSNPLLLALALVTAQQPTLPPALDDYVSRVMKWADVFVSFALNPDASIERARMVPVSEETDFSFDFQDLELKPVRPATRP